MSDSAASTSCDGHLDPFDEAYRRLVGYVGGGEDPADPADVLAMQMVLRIEKSDPPSRAELLTAAARAVALLCLDDRAGGGGPWATPMDTWCDARIRKIARRARGAQWVAAQEVSGLTVTEGAAQARALVPGRVGDVDRRISRLQIGGTDLSGELSSTADAGGVVLWLNPGVTMTVGKAGAQVGHAAMLAVKLMRAAQARAWRSAACPLTIRAATPERFAALLDSEKRGTAVAVRDAGFTEIAPGSVTVIAEVTNGE
ncbi:peptidyl-tRNA hydrolase [Gordonia sp. HNM0687]|uniref:peptidyl-tRNA hydrolase n=1 Tax=Gordonia mangrovi TaxID=2665643 RepID=A0A6L7GLX5_9ACTN|nr:peptidyl-tRNA hydrolase [Gordonia mangrovi]MXP20876.1 peptidyl-tRNA hydrolase [Gordonia mangrovi]UVF78571.1 peptidyl-tRNA hydrolase [Gordonia mangrovi]